jgi:hypothetical protein
MLMSKHILNLSAEVDQPVVDKRGGGIGTIYTLRKRKEKLTTGYRGKSGVQASTS